MTDCKDCGGQFVGPSFAVRCPACYDAYLTQRANGPMRACSVCKAYAIPANDPPYRIFCGNCYKEKSRPCNSCDRRIAPNAPAYQVKCTQCFLATRAMTHDYCPTCPPERANRLTKKKTDPVCSKCATQTMPPPPTPRPQLV